MPNKPKTAKKVEIKENYSREDLIFALDIGTRTVVGIVGFYENEYFKVIAAEVYEHRSRAMLDGQIHDINKVAEVVSEVKERLETALGLKLTKVAIAAAGRVLKTSQTKLEYEIEQGREITPDIVGSMEVDAIQNAQIQLDNELSAEEKVPFYCVGYSVVNYFLNGYTISSLIGHKGKKIGVEVLATFLPHVVVDSLYTVMEKVGLKVAGLTLEPIAAISVTIPKDLRLLNLVLVDIGAGTSDIAITKDGSVVAYGMVPIAGDEITEKIAQEFLVDFNAAEKIKISITSGVESIKYTDILGNKREVDNAQALEALQPAIEVLANSIADKILEFNQKAPNAVFLIGGGSQISGLTGKIAGRLGINSDRVAVRGRDVIHNIKTKLRKLSGPESITPFGIAMMAHSTKGQDFLSVSVNGEKIQLLNSKKLTVADALILVGFNPNKLIGRTGKSLKFNYNGKPVLIKGEHGEAAEILVNEAPASLDTIINVGDNITVKAAVNGRDAVKQLREYIINPNGLKVSLNKDTLKLVPQAAVNGENRNPHTDINDGDDVTVKEIVTLGQFAAEFNLDPANNVLTVNGEQKEMDYCLAENDSISCTGIEKETQKLTDSAEESLALAGKAVENDLKDEGFVITVNGEKVKLNEGKQYIFVDVFSYIDFDLTSPKGNIILKLNGKVANFTDSIVPGDVIEIFWEKFKI
ncbi:cell division protein FtsA [Ruminiclostridium cellobioparum]|uniref:Actin-like ATPase involved in cell division n=1 Tax=Ruminiclostridium cellobioparum subsp. termitidis CT1112 TaxID=1195236 RepID=S0FT04_RUMCE|nr:cell division protein FtsA [Ruminiclostridium cellobioparum]EMS73461.1 Actin-like ATPase involved in cell division [Ruminiclostridium cellobioparum subsp. termitidis CT1112]